MDGVCNFLPKYKLTFEKHGDSIVNSLTAFHANQKYLDLTFICEENACVQANKVVLMSVSELIKEIILLSNDEAIYISLPDVDSKIVEILLNFIYEGVTKVNLRELVLLKELIKLLSIRLYNTDITKVNLNDDVPSLYTEKNAELIHNMCSVSNFENDGGNTSCITEQSNISTGFTSNLVQGQDCSLILNSATWVSSSVMGPSDVGNTGSQGNVIQAVNNSQPVESTMPVAFDMYSDTGTMGLQTGFGSNNPQQQESSVAYNSPNWLSSNEVSSNNIVGSMEGIESANNVPCSVDGIEADKNLSSTFDTFNEAGDIIMATDPLVALQDSSLLYNQNEMLTPADTEILRSLLAVAEIDEDFPNDNMMNTHTIDKDAESDFLQTAVRNKKAKGTIKQMSTQYMDSQVPNFENMPLNDQNSLQNISFTNDTKQCVVIEQYRYQEGNFENGFITIKQGAVKEHSMRLQTVSLQTPMIAMKQNGISEHNELLAVQNDFNNIALNVMEQRKLQKAILENNVNAENINWNSANSLQHGDYQEDVSQSSNKEIKTVGIVEVTGDSLSSTTGNNERMTRNKTHKSKSNTHVNRLGNNTSSEMQSNKRSVFSSDKLHVLKSFYDKNRCPTVDTRKKIAEQLNVPVTAVTSWFYKMRKKDKKETVNNLSGAHQKEGAQLAVDVNGTKNNIIDDKEINNLVLNILENARKEISKDEIQNQEMVTSVNDSGITLNTSEIQRNKRKIQNIVEEDKVNILQNFYSKNTCPDNEARKKLADELHVPITAVTTWFYNMRRKNKRKTPRKQVFQDTDVHHVDNLKADSVYNFEDEGHTNSSVLSTTDLEMVKNELKQPDIGTYVNHIESDVTTSDSEKKKRKAPTFFDEEKMNILQNFYKENKSPSVNTRKELAEKFNVPMTAVTAWFYRMRRKNGEALSDLSPPAQESKEHKRLLTKKERQFLEKAYMEGGAYPSREYQDKIATELKLSACQVNNWFSLRRSRCRKGEECGLYPNCVLKFSNTLSRKSFCISINDEQHLKSETQSSANNQANLSISSEELLSHSPSRRNNISDETMNDSKEVDNVRELKSEPSEIFSIVSPATVQEQHNTGLNDIVPPDHSNSSNITSMQGSEPIEYSADSSNMVSKYVINNDIGKNCSDVRENIEIRDDKLTVTPTKTTESPNSLNQMFDSLIEKMVLDNGTQNNFFDVQSSRTDENNILITDDSKAQLVLNSQIIDRPNEEVSYIPSNSSSDVNSLVEDKATDKISGTFSSDEVTDRFNLTPSNEATDNDNLTSSLYGVTDTVNPTSSSNEATDNVNLTSSSNEATQNVNLTSSSNGTTSQQNVISSNDVTSQLNVTSSDVLATKGKNEEGMYKCSQCFEHFDDRKTFDSHIKLAHPTCSKTDFPIEEIQESDSPISSEKKCYGRKTKLMSADKEYTCDICYDSFKAVDDYVSHLKCHAQDNV